MIFIRLISCLAVHQFIQDWLCHRYRNRITHSFYFGGCRFRRVDTNQFSLHIEQCPTAVAGIDCCICLDQFPGCLSVFVGYFTIHRTDPSGSYGLSISQCITNGNYLFPDFQLIGIADAYYFNGFQSIFTHIRNFHSDYRQIVVGIRSLDLSFIHRIIIKSDRNSICISYYMIIRCYQDLTVILSYDDTGTGTLTRVLLHAAKEILYRFYRRIRNRYNRRHTTFGHLRNGVFSRCACAYFLRCITSASCCTVTVPVSILLLWQFRGRKLILCFLLIFNFFMHDHTGSDDDTACNYTKKYRQTKRYYYFFSCSTRFSVVLWLIRILLWLVIRIISVLSLAGHRTVLRTLFPARPGIPTLIRSAILCILVILAVSRTSPVTILIALGCLSGRTAVFHLFCCMISTDRLSPAPVIL